MRAVRACVRVTNVRGRTFDDGRAIAKIRRSGHGLLLRGWV